MVVRSTLLARSAFVLALCGAAGCARTSVLVAESGEHRLTGQDKDSGVTVVLTSGVWEGRPTELPRQWTVLHVLIANLGDTPLLIAPGDLELRDERGFLHQLLDSGAVFELADPDAAAHHYGRTYHRDYDPGGPTEFEPIEPPGTVAEHALPWGVLEPGTQMRGFIYFQPIEGNANRATLTWHLGSPEYERVVDLRFDLAVSHTRRKR
ncbi:MAG: hypothetical protein AAF799_35685 [Myxococcota bacterium]